jgi:hypothetical protein
MSGCGQVDVSKTQPGGGAGVPGTPEFMVSTFGFARLFRTFPTTRVFIHHAPSCTQPRYSSGLLKNDKYGDAASCELAAQRRREVDTPSTVVNVAQDDPRPSPAPI